MAKKRKLKIYDVSVDFFSYDFRNIKAYTKAEAMKKAIKKMAKPSMIRKVLNKKTSWAEKQED